MLPSGPQEHYRRTQTFWTSSKVVPSILSKSWRPICTYSLRFSGFSNTFILGRDYREYFPVLLSFVFAGMMIGGVVFGILSDKYGRKNSILAASGLAFIGGLGAAFTPNFAGFAVSRTLVGFAIQVKLLRQIHLQLVFLA